jgi:hypothetical protein
MGYNYHTVPNINIKLKFVGRIDKIYNNRIMKGATHVVITRIVHPYVGL